MEKALVEVKRKRNDLQMITGGGISPTMMPFYMNASDVVVQTSRFEASPMVIKEALACEVPIVSTDVGDVKDLISKTRGCYLCHGDPKDVAVKIDSALTYGKRTEGRNQIQHLDLKTIAKQVINVYEDILKRWKSR